jgi:hypothetical protein
MATSSDLSAGQTTQQGVPVPSAIIHLPHHAKLHALAMTALAAHGTVFVK